MYRALSECLKTSKYMFRAILFTFNDIKLFIWSYCLILHAVYQQDLHISDKFKYWRWFYNSTESEKLIQAQITNKEYIFLERRGLYR